MSYPTIEKNLDSFITIIFNKKIQSSTTYLQALRQTILHPSEKQDSILAYQLHFNHLDLI